MRTIIVMTIIGLVVCGGLVAVPAEEEKDLLGKAGQEALNRYEGQLKKISEEINTYIKEISSDGVVTGKEMVGLKEKVKSFQRQKQKSDNQLEIYGLSTTSTLDTKIERMVSDYFKHFLILRVSDEKDSIRKSFSHLTGRDIKIESMFVWQRCIFFPTGIALSISVMAVLLKKGVSKNSIYYIIPFGVTLVFIILLILELAVAIPKLYNY